MEQNKCCQTLNELVSLIESLHYPEFLPLAQEKYQLKQFKITQITPSFASEIYRDIFIKFMKNYAPKTQLNWGQNQLRLFVWILMCYIELKHTTIEALGEEDWEYFCSIFPNKQPILFEYQTKSLMNEPLPSKKWTAEEDQLFTALVRNKDNKYKWSELAKELYIGSQRNFYRTPKQCRERWLNHLDPNKSKDEWQLKEDYILISHVHTKGKKWAQISKLLKNRRNQHSIKNRFKSLITKEQKQQQNKSQQELIEAIYKKYDNHFSKMRLMNAMNNLNNNPLQQAKNPEEDIPTATNISQRDILNKETFQILKSSLKSGAKMEESLASIEVNSSPHIQVRPQASIPTFNSAGFMDMVIKQQRQKQIRADMFLSSDPFDFLKRFFKSKDQMWYN